jgi:hypothetical protein
MDLSLIQSIFRRCASIRPRKLTLLEAQIFSPLHYPPTPPDVDTLDPEHRLA